MHINLCCNHCKTRRLATAKRSRVSFHVTTILSRERGAGILYYRPSKIFSFYVQWFDHHAKFGCCFSYTVCVHGEVLTNIGDAPGPWLWGRGHGWPRRNTPLPICVIMPNLVVQCQTTRASEFQIRRKIGPARILPFKSSEPTRMDRLFWLPISDP